MKKEEITKPNLRSLSFGGTDAHQIGRQETMSSHRDEGHSSMYATAYHPTTTQEFEGQRDEQTIPDHYSKNSFNGCIAGIKNNAGNAAEHIQDGSKTTKIFHKILTSKSMSDTKRFTSFCAILKKNPKSAAVRNHHGSLPLHVVVRNNAKVDKETKHLMISALVEVYPEALIAVDAMGRTPLHIACEKWCTSSEARILIDAAPEAAAMKDKKGYLPIHIACSRCCSPEKLQMLLDAYPEGIDSVTDERETPLSIAIKTAKEDHPNSLLIQTLKEKLRNLEGKRLRDPTPCPGYAEREGCNEASSQPRQKSVRLIPDQTTSSSQVLMRRILNHQHHGNSVGQNFAQSSTTFPHSVTRDYHGYSSSWDDVTRCFALNTLTYHPFGQRVFRQDVAHFHEGDMARLARRAEEVLKQLKRENNFSLSVRTMLEQEHCDIITEMCYKHDLLEAQRQRIELENERLLLRIQDLRRIIDFGNL